jgi:hypothetical protein
MNYIVMLQYVLGVRMFVEAQEASTAQYRLLS